MRVTYSDNSFMTQYKDGTISWNNSSVQNSAILYEKIGYPKFRFLKSEKRSIILEMADSSQIEYIPQEQLVLMKVC
ncbi:hypothetical protein OFM36_35640, partial [Escherichia coli]|nr:hypothetical protein [Escherichia coli]